MYICIDIGGTAIKYGLADTEGNFSETGQIPTEAQRYGGTGIRKKVCQLIRSYHEQKPLAGVAISTAGIVDDAKGLVRYALPELLPGYSGTNWTDLIKQKFDLPCAVENDVNCAALGEYWRGAGKGATYLVSMTVGTSVGACTLWGGKVLHGSSQSAGEIAYMRVPGGKLYDLASARSLVANIEKAEGLPAGTLTGEQIFQRASAGDGIAQTAIIVWVGHIADGMANVISVVNPDIIVLGGGMMAQGDYLRPLLEKALQERLMPDVYERTRLAFAKLGNQAGMVGALYHLLHT